MMKMVTIEILHQFIVYKFGFFNKVIIFIIYGKQ